MADPTPRDTSDDRTLISVADAGPPRRVLVTGATGYIGGRLVPRLLDAGHHVRCAVRSPRKLEARSWHDRSRLEVVRCDLTDREQTRRALDGCDAAYFLVHSMRSDRNGFSSLDREIAGIFADECVDACIERLIYLGGLEPEDGKASEHLRSRREVGEILRAAMPATTELRAAMIIGAGSASFETLRFLTERLPVMVTPRWVRTESQPIAVRDALYYLVAALETPETAGTIIDIGSPNIVSYRELITMAAEELSLPRRIIIPVPVLSPGLSARWIGLITPLSNDIARPLAAGLRNRVVCTNDLAHELMPRECLPIREAVARAIGKQSRHEVETTWTDAGPIPGDPDHAGGKIFTDERTREIQASPEAVWKSVISIGGGNGWYIANSLWKLRGLFDQLIGGPGLTRGRRNPSSLRYGDALDFWRVTDIEQHRRLRLTAEMKLPGEADLTFVLEPNAGGTTLTQTARFRPKGLLGLAYWYSVLPAHWFVFPGMINGIRRHAERSEPAPA